MTDEPTPATKKFRKRPVEVKAYKTYYAKIIPTLEGDMIASPGDWIITGVNGEQYPCKPDIFAKTYEAVQDGPAVVGAVAVTEVDREAARKIGEHSAHCLSCVGDCVGCALIERYSRIITSAMAPERAEREREKARAAKMEAALLKLYKRACIKRPGYINQTVGNEMRDPVLASICREALSTEDAQCPTK